MASIEKLEKEIELLKERNLRVEDDKAWETSNARKVIIFVSTYLVIAVYFWFAKLPDPFLNAFVPALAFVLSTMSLPFFKRVWVKSIKK